jgi:hypothetical protein
MPLLCRAGIVGMPSDLEESKMSKAFGVRLGGVLAGRPEMLMVTPVGGKGL